MSVAPDVKKIVAQLNKEFGDGTAVLAQDMHNTNERIPSGSLTLDVALGGGWPANQWVELVGEASHGKALDISTPIPTPHGWTTMEKLQPGDTVFDERGLPCQVTYATDVQHGRTCYEVLFKDGTSLVADADHQWTVLEKEAGGRFAQRTVTTQYMVDKGLRHQHTQQSFRFRIPVCEPLQYAPAEDLPVDPYVLGAWLGDGTSATGAITTMDYEIVAQIQYAGYDVTAHKHTPSTGKARTYGVLGLHKQLRQAGVLNNKHIPEAYMFASVDDRIALLQGLMDTDGYTSPKGSCEFTTVSETLARQVHALLLGLGVRVHFGTGDATLNGRWISHKYRLTFRTDLPVFRLARKAQQEKKGEDSRNTYLHRVIVAINEVESRPVKCIQVDSPTSLYLAGEACIPTHNTTLALKTVAKNQALDPEFVCVWIAAEEFSRSLAEMCGVDLERVVLIESNIMETVYTTAIRFAESRAVDMVVLDSLPALIPDAENIKEMDEYTPGRGAILTNKFFRKVGAATKRSLTETERPFLGIVINQWREKIGVMHGDPRTTPGGKGKDFAYYVRCEVRRDEWINVGSSKDPMRVGQTIRVRTVKNKSAPPQQTAYIDFYFRDGGPIDAGGYDFGKEIVAVSLLTGVAERRGGWIYYGDRKWNGAPAFLDSVREEIDLAEQLEKETLSAAVAMTGGLLHA